MFLLKCTQEFQLTICIRILSDVHLCTYCIICTAPSHPASFFLQKFLGSHVKQPLGCNPQKNLTAKILLSSFADFSVKETSLDNLLIAIEREKKLNNCLFHLKEQFENVGVQTDRLMELVFIVMQCETDLSEQTSQCWQSFIFQSSQRVNPLLTSSLQHPQISAACSYTVPLISVCM